jgi:hypothetical protein
MEVWRSIPEFPNYSVSDLGRVLNTDTGRIMSQVINNTGNVYVGLTKQLVQRRRSVAKLVAQAFIPKLAQNRESFDTPIHLNGDRTDNRVTNLMWRPYWFAVKYAKQFNEPPKGFRVPIEEASTHEKFATSWDAATTYGLLDKEILVATTNRTYVWPTYQMFRVL